MKLIKYLIISSYDSGYNYTIKTNKNTYYWNSTTKPKYIQKLEAYINGWRYPEYSEIENILKIVPKNRFDFIVLCVDGNIEISNQAKKELEGEK